MFFYEFQVSYSCVRHSKMLAIHNEERSLWSERVAEINAILGADRLSEEYVHFVYRAIPGKFSMVVAIKNLQVVSAKKLENMIYDLIAKDYGIDMLHVSNLTEITCERLDVLLKRGEQSSYIITPKLMRALMLDYTNNSTFKLAEETGKIKRLSYTHAIQRAKDMLADISLINEIDRIYSKDNMRKKFYGHPVHYKISAENINVAMDIVRLLVSALYVNKRLLSQRINRIRNITEHCYAEDDLEHVVRCAEGGTIVLELWKDSGGFTNYASPYKMVNEFISSVIRKYQRNTLCVLVDVNPKFTASIIERELSDEMDFVEIVEGSGNTREALQYLKILQKNSSLPKCDEAGLIRELGECHKFKASEIYKIHDNLFRTTLKSKNYRAYQNIRKKSSKDIVVEEADAYKALEEMIGLTEQKNIVRKIVATFGVHKMKKAAGIARSDISYHMCFTGNPGTAKTTVARLLSEILCQEHIVPGKFVECGREDLVDKYVGWTATKVKEKFSEASGGILFIDEAYALVDDRSNSFGDEAINAIVQEMENRRNSVIVIFAGYPEKMEEFLESNSGLRSRISFHIHFPDYTPAELTDILCLMAKRKGYILSDSIIEKCRQEFEQACFQKDFGNGRFVRTVFERALMTQSQRLWSEKDNHQISKDELLSLTVEDFQADMSQGSVKRRLPLGFKV